MLFINFFLIIFFSYIVYIFWIKSNFYFTMELYISYSLFIVYYNCTITVIFYIYQIHEHVQCTMNIVHGIFYTAKFTKYTWGFCIMYTVQCTLYDVYCTMYTVYCTMYSHASNNAFYILNI